MSVYADWPLIDELKQVLNVESEDWDGDMDGTRLTGVLDSAITHVKREVGFTDYEDVPTAGMARAALRMAELMALRPESAAEADKDPVYRMHLYGEHRRWGIG
jgi:hypothetical protein